jgi:hypothetical protein
MTILTAQISDIPIAPVTTIDGDNVKISWTPPHDGTTEITGYTIMIRHYDDVSFSEELVNCDGLQTEIVEHQVCDVPISKLIVEPYYLPWGVGVYAKVSAINVIGASDFSL